MKKHSFIFVIALALMLASCSLPTRLVNTSTHKDMKVAQPVTAIFADLDVSPKKISFFFIPSKTVINGGEKNVINSAVREALLANGDADVLVGLEKQLKYNDKGEIESVIVSGYPAKYVNFRSPGDDYLREISKSVVFQGESGKASSVLGKLKIGK